MAGELLQAHFQFWCIASAHTLISALPQLSTCLPGPKYRTSAPSQMYPPPLPINYFIKQNLPKGLPQLTTFLPIRNLRLAKILAKCPGA